ncbi:phosphoribosylaminoimidazole carboxylase [Ophiostoma piceae UAMH 11346]|uniref:Phosphoribosylaminoimidazole carboxylase n=1 Tax=Ophiostoma piceae (strain UAMH 11346) TaxID=1262450 RepID=S3BTW4_OPHP1|nr:phosphoribosylaminoimidazole carboxylase [Ophiostoma piceae UAMH 11346]
MPSQPTIGLLGGGQLGQMLCEAASPLNIPIAVLDADDAPAKQINRNQHHVAGSFKDADKIRALAANSDVLTVEIEHIDTEVLEQIASDATRPVAVHPSWKTLRLVQNKYEQKAYLASKGIPVAEQLAIDTTPGSFVASLKEAGAKFGFPWMLKARKDSYDGRGNLKIATGSDAELAQAEAEFGHVACYAEKWVPFVMELSVMVIRQEDAAGNTTKVLPYPVVETVHEDNICSYVYMPPRGLVGAELETVSAKAQKVACSVIEQLWGRGVFAVELFVTKTGDVLVNEIAPRPHNSGHLTIEAMPYMSQFKAQLAAILDLPLPNKLEPHVDSAIMINVLGGVGADSHQKLIDLAQSTFASKLGVYVHMYGKAAKPSRKIGHITLTGTRLSIKELETLAQPLTQLAQEIRQERLAGATKALRPTAAPAAPATLAASAATSSSAAPLVLVTMGSDSDLPVLKAGIDILDQFGVPWEVDITSAHRTPTKMGQVATDAAARGIKVIIAAAGGAAHLPGMIAAYTPLPVIGVPVKATHLDGIDSLLSIVQMPRGVPTATVAINNSTNAALLAIRILGAFMPELLQKMEAYQRDMEAQVTAKADRLRSIGVDAYLKK